MNSILMSSASTDWETPKVLFNQLNDIFKFTLDPCANASNALLSNYITEEMDGLKVSWKGHRVFCNPPYGKRTLVLWLKKAYEESELCPIIVMLIPSRTETDAFQKYACNGNVFFIDKRLHFSNHKSPATFPSALVFFNTEPIPLDIGLKGVWMRKISDI